jgi:hypothetical protein
MNREQIDFTHELEQFLKSHHEKYSCGFEQALKLCQHITERTFSQYTDIRQQIFETFFLNGLEYEKSLSRRWENMNVNLEILEKRMSEMEKSSKNKHAPLSKLLFLNNQKFNEKETLPLKHQICAQIEEAIKLVPFFTDSNSCNIWNFFGLSIICLLVPPSDKLLRMDQSLQFKLMKAKSLILQDNFKDAYLILNDLTGWNRVLLCPALTCLRQQVEISMYREYSLDRLSQSMIKF